MQLACASGKDGESETQRYVHVRDHLNAPVFVITCKASMQVAREMLG